MLNRAVWAPRAVSRVLLRLLLDASVPPPARPAGGGTTRIIRRDAR